MFTPGRARRPHREGQARAHHGAGRARHGWSSANGHKIGVVRADARSATAPTRRSRREIEQAAASRARRGSCSTCAATPAACCSRAWPCRASSSRTARIVSVRGRHRAERSAQRPGRRDRRRSMPVVVLVDGGSASASEIVTGALRDRGRATVVGTHTFGKGVFQEVETAANGGALDLTVGALLPAGRRDDSPTSGIKPQVRAKDNPKTERDEALPVALDTLAAQAQMSAAVRGRPPAPARRADRRGAREARPLPRGRAAVRARARGTAGASAAAPAWATWCWSAAASAARACAPDRAARRGARRARGADARPRPAPRATRAPRPPRPRRRLRRAVRGRRPRVDLRDLPTFTIDPDDAQGLRRRDLGAARGRPRAASGSTSPT